MQDLKMKDQVATPENAVPENDGPGHFKAAVVCIYASGANSVTFWKTAR